MTQPLTPEELTQLFQTIEGEPTGRLSELAKLAGLDLAEDYIGADLSGEELSGDNLSHANLSNTDLSNANLSNTDLSYVNLTDANLSNANLSFANLNNANLNNANLTNVNLSNANLSNATLNNANLNNANLSHANCRNTNLSQVKNITTTNVFSTLMIANLGVSEKEILALKQRGAIIDEAKVLNEVLSVPAQDVESQAMRGVASKIPEAVEHFLNYCAEKIARFKQVNNTGFIEIRCCPSQGQYKVECRSGDIENFLIPPEDLAVWKTVPLPRQRENLETVEHVLAKLDSALFETFCLQQGYATIVIWHRGQDGLYGFQFSPSVVHGIKPY